MKTNAKHLECDLNELLSEFGKDFSELSFCERAEGENISFDITFGSASRSFSYPFRYSDPIEKKRFEKRYAKLSLYKFLSDTLSVRLPWGALTGVRPTKLARQNMDVFPDFFTRDMFVSQKKTDLVARIMRVQDVYSSGEYGAAHLFVSVPLCPSRCSYCSFISCEISKEKRVNEYIDALVEEIGRAKKLFPEYKTVYVGGGTPVALSDEDFERVLAAIGAFNGEYTVEAGRPDVITENKLRIMKRYGVTRVCVNPQTFSDKTLSLIGRKHTSKDILEKYALVSRFGFSVNMDLIAGLPEETFDDFVSSLETTLSLDPDNITVHTLALKAGSKLKESTGRVGGEVVSKMVDYAHDALASCGYEPYYLYRQKYMAENLENTGYCKKGTACVYNIDVMEETANVVACGANAISKSVSGGGKKIVRLGSPKDIASYLVRVKEISDEKSILFGQNG